MLWNYSKEFLNIEKRVNWDASRVFAIGGTLLLYTIQPLLVKLLNKIKKKRKIVIAILIAIAMIIDIIFSLLV